ncbi:C40 family peptidase [Chitinophaga sp. Cy-1792]|uniref:C40 family peptidase n=1 Tax=Chitinophaga sp. Cy-1792 TaxID=2608339 RepID=UPI0014243E8B|nr:C40 family peptidase [Chitinophaga sp. Cy-1792]NIG54253.1 NlpC/P60 family protein [Chitinophaga sp. Cy-1792]
MPYAVVTVPVAPLRMEWAHRSEMISQLLWGECVEILASAAGGWVQVRNQYDDYIGWATESHLQPIDELFYKLPVTGYLPEWSNEVIFNGQPMMVPFGCLVKCQGGSSNWGQSVVNIPANLATTDVPAAQRATVIRDAAMKYLNTAYLWGGRSVFGVDCSGLTQNTFKLAGIELWRDAYQQATQGNAVDFLQEAQLGDLAFFDNEEGRITHVGILLNDQEIIHSSGKVRIDPIDNQGIINRDTGIRTHKLRIIKRLL